MKKSNVIPHLDGLGSDSTGDGFEPVFLSVPFMICIGLVGVLPCVAG